MQHYKLKLFVKKFYEFPIVPDLFNFQRILCKKESDEASMLIWTNFDSFVITYVI